MNSSVSNKEINMVSSVAHSILFEKITDEK